MKSKTTFTGQPLLSLFFELLQVVAEGDKYHLYTCSFNCCDQGVGRFEDLFYHCIGAFTRISFATYSPVAQFILDFKLFSSYSALHGGAIAPAGCAEISPIPVNHFSLLGEVYLTVMN